MRRARGNPASRCAPPARRGAWVALALVGLAAGCSRGAGGAERPPDVLLVVLDTVRADHLSCYGYELPTTPFIDALAERGDRYTQCRSSSSWTLPSHASIFTGLYPFRHGAQFRMDAPDERVSARPLAPAHRTLAEALRDEGYRTGAVVANTGYLGRRLGFDQGFDHYDVERPRGRLRTGGEVTELALEWLDSVDPERPVFLFLNYMDAHRPYNTAPLPEDRARHLPPPDPASPQALLDELARVVLETDEDPSEELVRRVISQYDNGLAHLDVAVEGLVSGLEARGRWANTVFILTSDHGEFFGEHDLVEHSRDVYEEGLHVPLIVRGPATERGRVVEERITIAAIPHLVARSLSGASRERLAATFPDPGTGSIFAEIRYTRPTDIDKPYGERFMRERTVLYSGEYKAIFSSDGEHELYDLSVDPSEEHNLVDLLQAAKTAKESGEVAGPTGEPVTFDERELDALRELGYMGEDDGEDAFQR